MSSGLNKGTFAAFNPQAPIFEEIKKQQPEWWEIFRNDKELYIHIRKDNYINIYYYGESVAKIEFKNGDFSAKIHKKYFPFESDLSNVAKKRDYIKVNMRDIVKNLKCIKDKIKTHYSDWNQKSEKPKESWVQGKLILKYPNKYIDSQFAYKGEKLRIDLIELSPDGELSFTELKLLYDGRLKSEIIDQIKTYKKFVSDKKPSIIVKYYENLIQVRKDLQLYTPLTSNTKITLNPTINLLIIDTYKKDNEERKTRTENIKKMLENHKIKNEVKHLSKI